MPAEEEPTLERFVKSRLVRIGLTVASLAAALMAGAASWKVG
jgi:hypothetical protein